ncbi:MAG: PhzF family phenazine biosynthesis protein [Candidatus Scalindua sp.]|nr:PhzF family phenazine biosynthesis protein [Candidatus Scalindua sp.]MBT6051089.1 PhzF family phenazine biosynthesis protein [Candidatus Scalindua sp.]MBT6229720.1 PhzF family phenazine biosynthesis protein [Candidatus Scalindua sp.]MBT6563073.1 PhzF family phenazine biosynthesis protein [Candidatus Scalindua sp.]MBT7212345.1 PhzF family phenazine biosynthesis protein [Candidatus Scalindua sp.]
MELDLYQIDAFTDRPFQGNPAAVIPLETWLPDNIMQSIAEENNLSETVFFVPTRNGFHIRWFTPETEVDLCGHATLAAAYVLFNILKYNKDKIEFKSKSGTLTVSQKDDWLVMDFPAQPPIPCNVPDEIVKAFGKTPIECLRSEDYIVVFETESDIIAIKPDIDYLKKLDLRGVIITAKSGQYDFVSRFFAPKYGIDEDPVTGSAHTQLVPYWARKLDKATMKAKQVSEREGEIVCELRDDRVLISGKAVKFLEGRIELNF